MAKDPIKDFVQEYWPLFVEGILTPIILYAFMPINRWTFLFGLLIIAGEVYIVIKTLSEGDFKLLFVYLITEGIGESNGK